MIAASREARRLTASITTTGVATTSYEGTTYQDYAFYAGSGGGISVIEAQPAYQTPVVPAALATTLNTASGNAIPLTPHRVAPDISAFADPYTGYLYGETFTIAGNSISDAGCTKTGDTTEYCETQIGGTSLASPVTAGIIATVDEIRGLTGRKAVGFANPWLYSLKVGNGPHDSGLIDVKAPTTPVVVLRGCANDLNRVRVVTIGSVPGGLLALTPFPLQLCSDPVICEGIDDVFNTTTDGYDDVTGLGVPFVPVLAFQ